LNLPVVFFLDLNQERETSPVTAWRSSPGAVCCRPGVGRNSDRHGPSHVPRRLAL